MCGIVGLVRIGKASDTDFSEARVNSWIQKSADLMFHRGPDSGGSIVENGVGFGVRRLKVHDLSPNADQPFITQKGQIVLVFNGAIFNFKDLRTELRETGCEFHSESDTEVIAKGYEVWGESIVERLDGMFSFALFDRVRERVIIARDKLGIKPLYIARHDTFWAFASEIKPLLSHPDIPKEVNWDAIPEQLAFQFLMPPTTLFKGIEVFRPGKIAVIDLRTGQADERFYWQLDGSIIKQPDALNLDKALEVSLNQCWDVDRQAGVQLSGGVDSSLVCLLSCQRLGLSDYPTFSVTFDDSIAKYYLPRSEKVSIDRIASQCHLENSAWTFQSNEVLPALPEAIWYHEQPLYGASCALYMLLARKIKPHATVLLTGEGADDIFLGYFNDWDFSLSPESMFKFFIKRDKLEGLVGRNGFESAVSQRWNLLGMTRTQGMSIRQKASVATIETVLHGLLARHDRMFMSASVEGRPPFCTNNMISARFAMDDDKVHDGSNGKLALKQMLSAYTDHEFAFRKKVGFSAPFGDWCSDPEWWNGYVQRLDLDFLSEAIDVEIMRKHSALPEGKEKWSNQNLNMVFSLTQLQLWHDIFFGDTDFSKPAAWSLCVPGGAI